MSVVKKYKTNVVAIDHLADGVYSVEFVPESGVFKYKPGQFLHLALDEYDPSGAWPDSRCFSIQSPPGGDRIRITYAVKGLFTKRMEKELLVGQPVWLKLPYGDLFTQEHNKMNTVFIAGGTGITPFLSLFTSPDFLQYQHPKLYFGVRNRAFNFYERELNQACQVNNHLQIITFNQDVDGIIDIAQIFRDCEQDSSFFISGPPEMISYFREYLVKEGINREQVKTDDWE